MCIRLGLAACGCGSCHRRFLPALQHTRGVGQRCSAARTCCNDTSLPYAKFAIQPAMLYGRFARHHRVLYCSFAVQQPHIVEQTCTTTWSGCMANVIRCRAKLPYNNRMFYCVCAVLPRVPSFRFGFINPSTVRLRVFTVLLALIVVLNFSARRSCLNHRLVAA